MFGLASRLTTEMNSLVECTLNTYNVQQATTDRSRVRRSLGGLDSILYKEKLRGVRFNPM